MPQVYATRLETQGQIHVDPFVASLRRRAVEGGRNAAAVDQAPIVQRDRDGFAGIAQAHAGTGQAIAGWLAGASGLLLPSQPASTKPSSRSSGFSSGVLTLSFLWIPLFP